MCAELQNRGCFYLDGGWVLQPPPATLLLAPIQGPIVLRDKMLLFALKQQSRNVKERWRLRMRFEVLGIFLVHYFSRVIVVCLGCCRVRRLKAGLELRQGAMSKM